MTYSRRTFLAAGATGTIALTAGCVDFVLGNEPLELTTDRVAPTDEALEDADYDEYEVENQSVEETIDVGLERDIEASVWLSVYSREIDYQGQQEEGCFFAAVSIPDFSILGRSLNPLANMGTEELLEEFLDEIESEQADVENISHNESFSLPILGDGREVDQFDGETEIQGEQVDIEIAMTSFTHDDDLIVLFGSYPPLFEESATIEELMESVEHPA